MLEMLYCKGYVIAVMDFIGRAFNNPVIVKIKSYNTIHFSLPSFCLPMHSAGPFSFSFCLCINYIAEVGDLQRAERSFLPLFLYVYLYVFAPYLSAWALMTSLHQSPQIYIIYHIKIWQHGVLWRNSGGECGGRTHIFNFRKRHATITLTLTVTYGSISAPQLGQKFLGKLPSSHTAQCVCANII